PSFVGNLGNLLIEEMEVHFNIRFPNNELTLPKEPVSSFILKTLSRSKAWMEALSHCLSQYLGKNNFELMAVRTVLSTISTLSEEFPQKSKKKLFQLFETLKLFFFSKPKRKPQVILVYFNIN